MRQPVSRISLSVGRRSLYRIDHEDFDHAARRFELQPKLLFERGEQHRCIVYRRGSGCWNTRSVNNRSISKSPVNLVASTMALLAYWASHEVSSALLVPLD